MRSTIVCLLFSFIAFSQGGEVDVLGANSNLNDLTKQLKSDGHKAVAHFQNELTKFHSELERHEMVKRDIESLFNAHLLQGANCKTEVQDKLNNLKNKAVNDYMNCTSKTIYRAVGDSVKIVTVSFNMFSDIFSAIDDIINGFTECYSNGVWNGITCTVTGIGAVVIDVRQSVEAIMAYGHQVTSLGSDVTNIIHVCKNKNVKIHDKAYELVKTCQI